MVRSILIGVLVLTALPASAGPIVFDFRGGAGSAGAQLDGAATGTAIAIERLTATFFTSGGLFNQNAGGFGINATGSGDKTDQIDDGSGLVESMFVTFDRVVRFRALGVSLLGGSDHFDLTVAGDLDSAVGTESLADGFYLGPLLDTVVPIGLGIAVGFASGNGFSLDSLAVDVESETPIPEPGTFGLVGLVLIAGGLVRVGRRRSTVLAAVRKCIVR